jgi:two-component system sensor histidine kinase TctE
MHINSLRRRLLKRLLWPLVSILAMGAVLAYLFALHAAMNAYDLGLLNEALDLSKQVAIGAEGRLTINLPLAARQMLQANNEDHESYAAWDAAGQLFSGSPQLLVLKGLPLEGGRLFYDFAPAGEKNRAIVLRQQLAGKTFYIAIAQTMHGRERLAGSIVAGILLPEALLAFVSVAIIAWGVRQGLAPVDALRNEIVSRSPSDLKPIEEASAPTELSPIIHGINELLGNLAAAFAGHRRFIADAAHQLRTPLASLSSQIEVALEQTPADIKALLRQLLATTQRTTHLSNQLLSLARLEHTEQAMHEAVAVELEQVLREASADFVRLAARKDIEIDFALQPARVCGSPLMLRELLINLLDNAVSYTPAGGLISISLAGAGSMAWLAVENNGVRVPEEELAKLGTPFHRLPSDKIEGCGLGLAIVREIARLHNAVVSFHPGQGGAGLLVRVGFPLCPPAAGVAQG